MDTCRDISVLVSRAMDERLGPAERLRIRLHLLMCGACRRFQGQVQLLRTAARAVAARTLRPGPGDDPPPV
jgi:predicted anti-sigma-YlaC factor YlaD